MVNKSQVTRPRDRGPVVGNGSSMRLEPGERVRNVVAAECDCCQYEPAKSVPNRNIPSFSTNIGRFGESKPGKDSDQIKAACKCEASI